jgi:uncharacterized membrane protein
MAFATLFATLIFLFCTFLNGDYKNIFSQKGKSYAFIGGLSNGLSNYLTILLVSLENASIMYPIISAGTLLAAMFSGILIFKEKQPLNRIIGFIFGLATVVLLKI